MIANAAPIDLPLRDIHLPDPVSWWPLAIGWWILLGTILVAIGLIVFYIRKYFQPTLKKKAALTLNSIQKNFQEGKNAAQSLAELSAFLRKATLSQNPHANMAGIIGQEWLEVLDRSLDKPEFSQGVGRILLKGPYQPQASQEEVAALIELCRKWIARL